MAILQPVAVLAAPWCTLMFIGLWLRWQVSNGWPDSIDLQRPWWGGWASLLAIVSAAVWAQWLVFHFRQPASKAWLAIPSLCGLLSVVLQVAEVSDLANRQLLLRLDVHSRADLRYLSAVAANLNYLRNGPRVLGDSDRKLLDQLDASFVEWTEREVVSASELPSQLAVLRALAFDIFPREQERLDVERFIAKEAKAIMERVAELENSRQLVEAGITQQSSDLERLRGEGDASRDETLAAERLAVAGALTRLETDLQVVKLEQRSLAARQAFRQEMVMESVGLNARYPWLKLPVCLPGGMWWSGTFLASATLHIAYALVGILTTGFWWWDRPAGGQPAGVVDLKVAAELDHKLRFLRTFWFMTAMGTVVGYLFL